MAYVGKNRQVALYDAYTKGQVDGRLSTFNFAPYSSEVTYSTGQVVQGSNGKFYEFYDRDETGSIQGVDPENSSNRPHIWMEWDGVKPGSTIEWRSESLPEGYVENDGAEVSRGDYRRVFSAFGTIYGSGDGSTTFLLPDDRGEFKRGWDNGRGVDSGRALGSFQDHALEYHNHLLSTSGGSGSYDLPGVIDSNWDTNGGNNNEPVAGKTAVTDHDGTDLYTQNGGNRAWETRPRNVSTIYLTKI